MYLVSIDERVYGTTFEEENQEVEKRRSIANPRLDGYACNISNLIAFDCRSPHSFKVVKFPRAITCWPKARDDLPFQRARVSPSIELTFFVCKKASQLRASQILDQGSGARPRINGDRALTDHGPWSERAPPVSLSGECFCHTPVPMPRGFVYANSGSVDVFCLLLTLLSWLTIRHIRSAFRFYTQGRF